MIVLLDTSEPLDKAGSELGIEVGQLLTPLTKFADRGATYAIDNGAFSKFDGPTFCALLDRQWAAKYRCLWVAAPDVVGSARRTLECFDAWYPKLSGWRVALVVQDGIENLPIPWNLIDAVFIGGSTAFKVSAEAEAVVRAAKILGKWAHIGRVNTPERFDKFLAMGADSIDGTGISRYTHMRKELTSVANGLFGN